MTFILISLSLVNKIIISNVLDIIQNEMLISMMCLFINSKLHLINSQTLISNFQSQTDLRTYYTSSSPFFTLVKCISNLELSEKYLSICWHWYKQYFVFQSTQSIWIVFWLWAFCSTTKYLPSECGYSSLFVWFISSNHSSSSFNLFLSNSNELYDIAIKIN